jgi:phage gpG-like protein
MKLEIKVGVDFGKLASVMPKIIDEALKDVIDGSVEASRAKIDEGKFKPLKDSTLELRRRGTKHRPKTSSTKPLIHTGELYNSIRKDKKNLKMKGYGGLHEEGFITDPQSMIPNKKVPARPFISIGKASTENMIKSMRKSLTLKSPLVLKT